MMTLEFVMIDANGREVDWIDPVIDYKVKGDTVTVDNGFHIYVLTIPEGGRFDVRQRIAD